MALKDWSKTASSNNSASPDGFPEGMAPSGVNDSSREVMAQVRGWYEEPEWIDFGDTPVYVSSTQFKITGVDLTSRYHVNRRVKIEGTPTVYGIITATAYSTDTTVTVSLDSGSVPSPTDAVAVGPFSQSNGGMSPYIANNRVWDAANLVAPAELGSANTWTANQTLNNTIGIRGKETGGTARNLISMSSSDQTQVGSTDVPVLLRTSTALFRQNTSTTKRILDQENVTGDNEITVTETAGGIEIDFDRTITTSTSAPSGGANGDLWFRTST